MNISALGKQAGLRASAIRYYEAIGLLDPAPRVSGQRRYDARALRRLAVIRQARDAGFTLDEIYGVVHSEAGLAEAWRSVAQAKLQDIDRQMKELDSRRELIKRVQRCCQCKTVDECGRHVLKTSAR